MIGCESNMIEYDCFVLVLYYMVIDIEEMSLNGRAATFRKCIG